MELNTSQPQHSQIISKPSRNPILFIAIGVIVIMFVALGLLVWQKNQEIGQVLNQLADTEKLLTESVRSTADKATDLPALEKPMASRDEKDQQSAATIAASEYYCAISDFGCDKVSSQPIEFQKVTETNDGFAKVSAKNMSNQTLIIWLKYSMNGTQWVPFYEGQAMPSAEIIKRWSIPTDFLAVN